MSTHSVPAYRVLVRMRSGRTLMVEGDSDKVVMSRLMHEFASIPKKVKGRPIIDTPALVADDSLAGLGNKEKVLAVAQECAGDVGFSALVDREWDGFDELTLTLGSVSTALPASVSTTAGHSIENYFMEADNFRSLIIRNHAEDISAQSLQAMFEAYDHVTHFALAYSLAVKDHALLNRLSGYLRRSHLDYGANGFHLNHDFEQGLSTRGISAPDSAQLRAEVDRRLINSNAALNHVRKWASHGHIGYGAAWVCLSRIADSEGVDRLICEQLERGNNVDKLRGAADRLATGNFDRQPLDALVQWLAA